MRARAREHVLFFNLWFALDKIYVVNELRGERDEITLGVRKEKWVKRTNSVVTPMSATVITRRTIHAHGFTSGAALASSFP